MQFEIKDEFTLTVVKELAFRLNMEEEDIIQKLLRALAGRYVKQPTLGLHMIKSELRKKGGVNDGVNP